ncbi:MalY/PatB family protein [Bacillus solimangrovi]|uniref:cysteine-S-conjugate beta-lyase n=1 Tax=Bacillus solimangrovi TaxID=1305675 RepID=A0A1E5LF47_9BACI|nr:MalY/PatB family protein [Bacillus solimangrovi]OEH92705.1 cystathionine beta-lyase [Bacillus solimangrovi]
MNFDQLHNRKGSDSAKWDGVNKYFGEQDLHPMWVADMDFPAPQPVIEALNDKVEHGIYGYPHVPDSTYQSITGWLSQRHQWEINQDWISFILGVVPAISTIIHALTEVGDKIIIQPPVYYPFFGMVEDNERVLSLNPLKLEDGQYKIDFDHLEQIIDNETKMLILCSPHNPVGRVWSKDELQKLGDICIKNNILVISDEIHADLTLNGQKHVPFASISKEFADISITCLAPSKTFNLAGTQAAYMIIPNDGLRKKVDNQKKKQGLYALNIFGLTALEAAYTHGGIWLDSLMEYIEDNVKLVKDFLETELPSIRLIEPEGTYLLWIDCRALNVEHKKLERALLKEGKLALNQGYTFGENGQGFIRMNIATQKAHIQEGLKRLKQVIDSVQG